MRPAGFVAAARALTLLAFAGCATIDEDEIETGAVTAPADLTPKTALGVSPAAPWGGWRGSFGDGRTLPGVELPAWPDGKVPSERWRRTVGAGFSGVVVADGKVFCHSRIENDEIVTALDRQSGQPVWEQRNALVGWKQPWEAGGISSGPLATPCYANGRVYTVGVLGFLQCLDASSGERLFSASPETVDGNPANHRYGHAASPLVHAGRLYWALAAEERGSIVALDATNGDLLWRSIPEIVSYASPTLASFDGVEQLVVRSWERVVGLDPASGDLCWEHEAIARSFTRDCATPLVVGSMVYLTNNLHGTIAVRVERKNDAWNAERVFRSGALGAEMASPVYRDGYLYGLHKTGRFAAMDARTGKRAWVARAFGHYLSLIVADDIALALDEDGAAKLLRLQPTGMEMIASWQLGEYTWAYPAIDSESLYLRDGNDVVCLPLR